MKKSFSLIELIFTLSFLTVGIGSIYSLISQFHTSSSVSSQKLIAAYLAQEGIEIVRNIRDTNLLENENWDNNLENGNWQADFKDNESLRPCPLTCDYDHLSFLNFEDSTGFFGYGNGTLTPFKRKIELQKFNDFLNIKVTVFWKERGRSHQITVQENLYNWQQQ